MFVEFYAMPLTTASVRTALPRTRLYRLSDRLGLLLEVPPTGSKRWRFRYRFNRAEKLISLGLYPTVSLRAARLQRDDARGLLARGIDPSVDRQLKRAARLRTFELVARDRLKSLGRIVEQRKLSEGTLRRATWILESHLFPRLGHRPIDEISAAEVLTVLKGIELRGLRDTARRARQSCSRVFRHAMGLGYISRDLTIESRELLEPPITQHHPGINDPMRLGELLRSIDGYTGREVVAIALQLAPLFFVRPGELRQARWRQVDVPDALWHIPAECMKKRVPHVVPLSRQALQLLKRLREVSGTSEYLFPAQRNPAQPIAGNALNIALRRMGFSSREITPHGFRATASTLLSELGWRSEVIERQLAHADADRMRRIYNHAQYLTERRAMMQTWADYLDGLRKAPSYCADESPQQCLNLLPLPHGHGSIRPTLGAVRR